MTEFCWLPDQHSQTSLGSEYHPDEVQGFYYYPLFIYIYIRILNCHVNFCVIQVFSLWKRKCVFFSSFHDGVSVKQEDTPSDCSDVPFSGSDKNKAHFCKCDACSTSSKYLSCSRNDSQAQPHERGECQS
jgi:hypothetical protein